MITKRDLKRMKAFEREQRMEQGHRSTETQTIPSRKEKDADARKQRKQKHWLKDWYSGTYA